MSARPVGRTKPCSGADANARLRQARLYVEVAELVVSDEPGEQATVATGNAVLAGIAAADAICCSVAGERFRGDDHRRAAEHLGCVTGDAKLARALRDLIDLKDASHYGVRNVQVRNARRAVRKATQLIDAAADRIRRGLRIHARGVDASQEGGRNVRQSRASTRSL